MKCLWGKKIKHWSRMAFTIGNALALPLIKMVIGKEGDV
jgi:hypothetical protein